MGTTQRNTSEVPIVKMGEYDDVIRIVLLGKTGAGKSSTGNILAGYDVFPVAETFDTTSLTDSCSMFLREIQGKQINVIDTPGLCDTDETRENGKINEIIDVISLASPEPYVFLIVIKATEKFDRYIAKDIAKLKELFGKQMMERAIIVLTGIGLNKSYYKLEQPESLKNLMEEVKQRSFLINSDDMQNDPSRIANELVKEILRHKLKTIQHDEFKKAYQVIEKEAGTRVVQCKDETMRSMIWRIKTDGDIEGSIVPLATEEYQRIADTEKCKDAINNFKADRENVYPHLKIALDITSPNKLKTASTLAGIVCVAGTGVAVFVSGGAALPIGIGALVSLVFSGPSINEKLKKDKVMTDLNSALKKDLSLIEEIRSAAAESLSNKAGTVKCIDAIQRFKEDRANVYPHLDRASNFTSQNVGILFVAGIVVAAIFSVAVAVPFLIGALMSLVYVGSSSNEKLMNKRMMWDVNSALRKDLSMIEKIRSTAAESRINKDHMSRKLPGLTQESIIGTILNGVVCMWHQGTLHNALKTIQSVLKKEQAMRPAELLQFLHQKRTLYDKVNKSFYTWQRRRKLWSPLQSLFKMLRLK